MERKEIEKIVRALRLLNQWGIEISLEDPTLPKLCKILDEVGLPADSASRYPATSLTQSRLSSYCWNPNTATTWTTCLPSPSRPQAVLGPM